MLAAASFTVNPGDTLANAKPFDVGAFALDFFEGAFTALRTILPAAVLAFEAAFLTGFFMAFFTAFLTAFLTFCFLDFFFAISCSFESTRCRDSLYPVPYRG